MRRCKRTIAAVAGAGSTFYHCGDARAGSTFYHCAGGVVVGKMNNDRSDGKMKMSTTTTVLVAIVVVVG